METSAYIFANERHHAPREDALAWDDGGILVAADGVTREWDALERGDVPYPDPSPAGAAADAAVRAALSGAIMGLPLREALAEANAAVGRVNDALGITEDCDYLERDFAGTVAAIARISGSRLEMAWIGDCGIAVIREDAVAFLTRDQLDGLSAYLSERPAPLNDARRVFIRRDLRNRPGFRPDGRTVTYGVLTGEPDAIPYIETASLNLQPGDVVAVHTDGFRPYFADPDFVRLLNRDGGDWDRDVPAYTLDLAERDTHFGRERSLLLARVPGV